MKTAKPLKFSYLAFFLFQTMFKEHDHGPLLSIDVLLESLNLVFFIVAIQVSHHPMHVILQVVHIISLLAKSCLNEPVVEDKINTRFNSLLSAFSSILCTGITSNIKVITNLSGHMLSS